MLTAYLDIEKTRWGDLLQVDLAVSPPADEAKIPSLLLLPLVEIVHRRRGRSPGKHLWLMFISAALSPLWLMLGLMLSCALGDCL